MCIDLINAARDHRAP